MRGGKWTPSPNTTKGVSDIVAIKPTPLLVMVQNLKDLSPHITENFGGKFVAIEVKRPGGKVSADQSAFLEGVRAAGGIGIVAYSVKDVQAVFD